MSAYPWRPTIGLAIVGLILAGCSTDREQAAIGKWKADGSAIGMAIRATKLKSDSPDASTGEIMGAARAIGATTLTLRADKTAEVIVGGNTIKGTWTIDKQAGEVTLTLTAADAAPENDVAPENKDKNPDGLKPQTWIAFLSDDNSKLRLYMAPKEAVAMIRKDGKEGAGSILLSKRS